MYFNGTDGTFVCVGYKFRFVTFNQVAYVNHALSLHHIFKEDKQN